MQNNGVVNFPRERTAHCWRKDAETAHGIGPVEMPEMDNIANSEEMKNIDVLQ